MGKGGRRVRKCAYMYENEKMAIVETIPGIREEEEKREW
jgi:hypothetical protein